jgi:hypothetical protein
MRLHGAASQKAAILLLAAVSTSNATFFAIVNFNVFLLWGGGEPFPLAM